jgi:hypothetical protein
MASSSILLWIIHHVLLRLLARLGLLVVGVMGLGRCTIEGRRGVPRAIAISRCIHGWKRAREGYDRLAGMVRTP